MVVEVARPIQMRSLPGRVRKHPPMANRDHNRIFEHLGWCGPKNRALLAHDINEGCCQVDLILRRHAGQPIHWMDGESLPGFKIRKWLRLGHRRADDRRDYRPPTWPVHIDIGIANKTATRMGRRQMQPGLMPRRPRPGVALAALRRSRASIPPSRFPRLPTGSR